MAQLVGALAASLLAQRCFADRARLRQTATSPGAARTSAAVTLTQWGSKREQEGNGSGVLLVAVLRYQQAPTTDAESIRAAGECLKSHLYISPTKRLVPARMEDDRVDQLAENQGSFPIPDDSIALQKPMQFLDYEKIPVEHGWIRLDDA